MQPDAHCPSQTFSSPLKGSTLAELGSKDNVRGEGGGSGREEVGGGESMQELALRTDTRKRLFLLRARLGVRRRLLLQVRVGLRAWLDVELGVDLEGRVARDCRKPAASSQTELWLTNLSSEF